MNRRFDGVRADDRRDHGRAIGCDRARLGAWAHTAKIAVEPLGKPLMGWLTYTAAERDPVGELVGLASDLEGKPSISSMWALPYLAPGFGVSPPWRLRRIVACMPVLRDRMRN